MLRAMTRTLRLASLLALLGVVMPGVAIAHGGGEPWIHVPAQSIEPGQPFELWGADLGPDASVAVEIVVDQQSIQLGSVTADAEGHFTQTLTLPAGVPEGYRQLHADSSAGVDAFMWVLVGQNTSGAVNPSAASGNEWWSDPSVLVLGAMLAAAMVAVLFLAFRSRRPASAKAAVESRARPLPRKGARARNRR
jgi:hypothetical protein